MKKIIIIEIDTKDSLVGEFYVPRDNSWSSNCETGEWESIYGQFFILSSEPYKKWISGPSGPRARHMIKAIHLETGVEYEILYNPMWIKK